MEIHVRNVYFNLYVLTLRIANIDDNVEKVYTYEIPLFCF